jgi:RND superfamily putative drug exporter
MIGALQEAPLFRLSTFCYRRRWIVLGTWVVALVLLFAIGKAAGGSYANNFTLPSSESQRAYQLLQNRFPAQSGDTVQVVVKADAGVNDPQVRTRFEALLSDLAKEPHVTGIQSPYGPGGQRQVSKDGTIAYATVQFNQRANSIPKSESQSFLNKVNAANGPGMEVAAGGNIISAAERPRLSSEGIGLLAAVVILLVAFGSVLAMGLPIITALFGVGMGFLLIKIWTAVIGMPDFTSQIAAMIGIGVGIDYALFIVTRYRQGLSTGMEPEEAVTSAMTTAGRAVLFAGCTVIISLLGMFLINISLIRGMAVGAGSAVLTTMIAAVTLLPAILGFTGRNIDKLKVPGLHHSGEGQRGFWWRWSRYVQRRPLPVLAIGIVIVVGLALPVFKLRLGTSDSGSDPKSYSTYRAYHLLSQGFGPGYNGPFLLAVELPRPGDTVVLAPLAQAVAADPGIASVSPPRLNPAGDVAIIQAVPTTSPQDAATGSLLHRLRRDVIPPTVSGTGARVDVGGNTATAADVSHGLAKRLPIFIGVVVLLSFLLLMFVFRSILVPLKAAIMNLLSIGAAYGILVAIFQWGWGKNIVGLSERGPIQFFVPMMLFAILFGLSMDYEVFLMSRIREEYLRNGGDNGAAVADGLAATARVITAAALIMITVFGSFVLGDNVVIKMFGLGLAAAIFIDATVIRMVIVPSTMELLGNANWWLPRWLQGLPEIQLEPASLPQPVVVPAGLGVEGLQAAGVGADSPGD